MSGDLTEHYSRSEFRCPHCGIAKVSARLAPALEVMRAAGRKLGKYPRGMRIVSGYRCPVHNRDPKVHGAPGSKHLTGEAADVDPVLTLAQVLGLGVFSGIGWKWLDLGDGRQQYVVHVDVGARAGHSWANPATWEYLPDGTRR